MSTVSYVADMVKSILMDDEIMTEKLAAQIGRALDINAHLTSCYALQVAQVDDILGRTSRESGWYITLEGTRCGVKFFMNNDMEISRKPNKNKVRVVQSYGLFNCGKFDEQFWCEWSERFL